MSVAPVLTIDDVAAMLQCKDTTVREIAPQLGGLKFGRDWVFPAEALLEALNDRARDAMRQDKAPTPPRAVLQAVPTRRRPPALPG
jgi:hypothetical protein